MKALTMFDNYMLAKKVAQIIPYLPHQYQKLALNIIKKSIQQNMRFAMDYCQHPSGVYQYIDGIFACAIYQVVTILSEKEGNNNLMKRLLFFVRHKTLIDISYTTSITMPCLLESPKQCNNKLTIIGGNAHIGKQCVIGAGVTIGSAIIGERTQDAHFNPDFRHPIIGNQVIIGRNTDIFGPVTIGSNSIIGHELKIVTNLSENSMIL